MELNKLGSMSLFASPGSYSFALFPSPFQPQIARVAQGEAGTGTNEVKTVQGVVLGHRDLSI